MLEVFRHMGDDCARLPERQRTSRERYIRSFYDVCVMVKPSGAVSAALMDTNREQIVGLLRDSASQLLKARASTLFHKFGPHGVWKGYVLPWVGWPPITHKDVGYQKKPMNRHKVALTEQEVKKLFDVSVQNARDDALLRFYIHTGCRRMAACELLVDDVYDRATGTIRESGRTLEKFSVMRSFTIDRILGEALKRWIEESGVTTYVFPCLSDKHRRWNPDNARIWLKQLATKAGIVGNHVFVHGLRHTTITWLHKTGNNVDDIAAWIGHKSSSMTQHYVDRTVSRPEDRMLIPWLPCDDVAGLRLSSNTIGDVIQQTMPNPESGSSSSSSTSSFDSNMLHTTDMSLRMITVLTQKVAALENELRYRTDEYNFMCSQSYPLQLKTLGGWQRQHMRGEDLHAAGLADAEDHARGLNTDVARALRSNYQDVVEETDDEVVGNDDEMER